MEVLNKRWEMVYRWLLSYIDKNKFSGNHKLPSENALCRDLKVSRDTVRLALEQLEREGLIYRVRGSGTFFDRETALSRELYTGTTKVKIGMILQGQDGDAESQLIKGVRSVLTEEQMDLRIFLTDNKFSNERRCLQTVVHQHFQGFIIDGVKASMASPNLDCYKAIQRKGIPMIFFNNYYQNLHCPKAGVDNAASAECLIDLLLKAGHRHIAGIFLYDNHQSIEKFQGLFATLQKHGIEFQDDYIKWCISNEAHDDHFAGAIWKFLKSVPRCTAVVCCNYRVYRLVRQVLADKNKRVPEDYSLVCFDYSGENLEAEDVTCSVYQGYKITRQVTKHLIKMIHQEKGNNQDYSLVIPPEIHIGSSIRNL